MHGVVRFALYTTFLLAAVMKNPQKKAHCFTLMLMWTHHAFKIHLPVKVHDFSDSFMQWYFLLNVARIFLYLQNGLF